MMAGTVGDDQADQGEKLSQVRFERPAESTFDDEGGSSVTMIQPTL
jgi:hypothetical protein